MHELKITSRFIIKTFSLVAKAVSYIPNYKFPQCLQFLIHIKSFLFNAINFPPLMM